MVEILYHYTSLESLFHIIQGSNGSCFSLRASHASFLNDLNEGMILPKALKRLGVNYEDILLSEARQGYPFILSLSELNDDLNMWRCYADKGKGVSIGFDKFLLEESFDSNSFKLNKCIYVKIEELVKKLHERNVEIILKSQDLLALDRIIADMFIYKDKSFSAENEWRIHGFDLETNYRVKDNYLIPYKDVKIPLTAISSITLGPKCDRKNHFTISRILKSKNVKCDKITSSRIPLL